MKKMVFSYFNVYEQERGAETEQNQYENMGEQALLNEMETRFGADKDTYGKLQRTSGYKNFFTAVMNKLMAKDKDYPKAGSFSDKVGHYQSKYMDIHQEGNANFKTAADKKLGPTTRDYMKGWLQAIVDQGSKTAPVAPSIPKPVYSTDTSGVSNLRVDLLPDSGKVDIKTIKTINLQDKLDQLGVDQRLFDRGKQQGYITADGRFNIDGNTYIQSQDKKSITINFANKQKITLPLASIVDKGADQGDILMDEVFKFNGANFARAVFAEFPKKITEATDKTIGAYQTAFNVAYSGCMNTLKTNKGRPEKIDAINTAIRVTEPIQRKVYDITKKEGPNQYYNGTLAEKTASDMYNQIAGLKLQLEAHTAGKDFFDTWYKDVSTFVLDEDGEPTEERTTVFDKLNQQATSLNVSDPTKSGLESLDAEIKRLSNLYELTLSPKYTSYEQALSAANPQATIDTQFNPARFADILNNSRAIHTNGINAYLSGAQSLSAVQ